MPSTLQEMGLPYPELGTSPRNGPPVGVTAGETHTGAMAGKPVSSTTANVDNIYVQTHMSTSPNMGNTLLPFMLMPINLSS